MRELLRRRARAKVRLEARVLGDDARGLVAGPQERRADEALVAGHGPAEDARRRARARARGEREPAAERERALVARALAVRLPDRLAAPQRADGDGGPVGGGRLAQAAQGADLDAVGVDELLGRRGVDLVHDVAPVVAVGVARRLLDL